MTRILIVAPGHSFSTHDVFTGLCAGMTACGVEVIPYRWDRHLQTFNALATAGMAAGLLDPSRAEQFVGFTSMLASADVISVAIEHDVDAVLVVTGLIFPAERVKLLRKLGIPVACYGTEAPYRFDLERQIAPYYDHWFTQERQSVAAFAALTPTSYLPMAYNPETHHPAPADPAKACDVVFVGGGYPERKALLDGVDWTGIDHRRIGTLWDVDIDQVRAIGAKPQGVTYTAGAIPNEETSAWHRSASIALNMHRTMTLLEADAPIAAGAAESLGPRGYEIPAVGGFMLSDDTRPELWDVYGDSAATFRSNDSADLERQIRYWRRHPDEREQRRKAQHAAVKPHSWTTRARDVLATILP